MASNVPAAGYPAFTQTTNPNFPQNPAYAYYQQNQPYPYRRTSPIRRFCFGFTSVFVILGIILLIIWLIQHPRKPEFHVDSFTATNFNVSGSLVSGNWKLGLSVSNPNKKLRVSYEEIRVSLYYISEFIALTSVAPFDQETRSSSAMNVSFVASSSYVDRGRARQMMDDKAKGSVRFSLIGASRVRFRDGGWRLRPRILRVWCDGLVVGFSSRGGDGKLSGGSKDCEVEL